MGKMNHLLIAIIVSTVALSCGGVVSGDNDSDTSDAAPDEMADGTGDPAGDSTDDPAVESPVDAVPDETYPDECVLVIVEAESFATNEYWAECPGTGCEDDRSGTASGGGHLITYEDHYTSDPAGSIQTDVTLPRTGTWYVWARSVRAGSGREWQFGFNGTASSSIGSGEPVWELGGSFDAADPSAMLAIRDAAPDAYWAYPDAIIMSIVDTFDPNLCAGDGFEASHCLCD